MEEENYKEIWKGSENEIWERNLGEDDGWGILERSMGGRRERNSGEESGR